MEKTNTALEDALLADLVTALVNIETYRDRVSEFFGCTDVDLAEIDETAEMIGRDIARFTPGYSDEEFERYPEYYDWIVCDTVCDVKNGLVDMRLAVESIKKGKYWNLKPLA